jgi:hypothetical protein
MNVIMAFPRMSPGVARHRGGAQGAVNYRIGVLAM